MTTEITEAHVERYIDAVRTLIAEGHLDKGDEWLMQEACRRAGVGWAFVEDVMRASDDA